MNRTHRPVVGTDNPYSLSRHDFLLAAAAARPCVSCEGTGRADAAGHPCRECRGTGEQPRSH